MGTPKFLLQFDGEPLIAHIVRKLKKDFAEVVVVAAPACEFPDLPVKVVRDELPFQGPASGIYYGLQAAATEICYVSSCDVPSLNARLVQFIVAALGQAEIAVPFWQGRFQPLHAVYRKSVITRLKQQLEEGKLRPTCLY